MSWAGRIFTFRAMFQYKIHVSRYGSSHCIDTMISQLSYQYNGNNHNWISQLLSVYNGNSYTGETVSLYWNRELECSCPFWEWMLATSRNDKKCKYINMFCQQISVHFGLTLNMQGPRSLNLAWSVSWLLMPWLLTLPGHQQQWYWLCRVCRHWSYLWKDFKYLCHISVE